MKVAVVTAVIGGFDTIKEIPKQSVPYERFFYTEKNLPFPLPNINDRLKSKYIKIQTHRFLDHDIFIWLDGSVHVKSERFVEFFVGKLQEHDVAIGKHNTRDCVYDEMNYILQQLRTGNNYMRSRYSKEPIKEEMEYYRASGHPEHYGLHANGIFARMNNEKVNNCFNDWWDNCITFCNFDQTSFVFQSRIHNLKKNIIDWGEMGTLVDNEMFQLQHHLKHNAT